MSESCSPITINSYKYTTSAAGDDKNKNARNSKNMKVV